MTAKATRIDELARELEQRKNEIHRPVLILGSRAGGLFRSQWFYETLQKFSMRDFTHLSKRERFSACYSTLSQERISRNDILFIVQAALEELTSSSADACLADLLQQDLFQFVCTNNVDGLLENALLAQGMEEHKHFFVYYPVLDVKEMLYGSKPSGCKLIKLCGDERQFADDIHRGLFQKMGSDYLKQLLQRRLFKEVLLVGIDLDWDAGIIAAIHPEIETIWLVNEDEAVKDAVCSRYPEKKHIKYILGADGEYERFFRGISWNINQGMPKSYEETMRLNNQLNAIQEDIRQLRKENSQIKEILLRIERELLE